MPTMKQVFTVNHPKEVVWQKFKDIESVVECVPGASLTSPIEDGKAKGRVTVKLGPVKADFSGDAEITTDDATYTGKIAGVGLDKNHSSRAKGSAIYVVEEAGSGASKVSIDIEYTLSGSLAQFARGGIVEAVAEQICKDFATNLEVELSAASASVPAAPDATGAEAEGSAGVGATGTAAKSIETGAAARTAPKRQQKELNALSLLWAVFKNRLRKLFGRA